MIKVLNVKQLGFEVSKTRIRVNILRDVKIRQIYLRANNRTIVQLTVIIKTEFNCLQILKHVCLKMY